MTYFFPIICLYCIYSVLISQYCQATPKSDAHFRMDIATHRSYCQFSYITKQYIVGYFALKKGGNKSALLVIFTKIYFSRQISGYRISCKQNRDQTSDNFIQILFFCGVITVIVQLARLAVVASTLLLRRLHAYFCHVACSRYDPKFIQKHIRPSRKDLFQILSLSKAKNQVMKKLITVKPRAFTLFKI